MPERFEETVADFLRRQGLFVAARRILLAVSGGADSIALLHSLAALKSQGRIAADLVCAHINHQLRGLASDADERFVVEQARQLALPMVTQSVEVQSYAHTHGLSVETAGRHLRLAALRAIAHSQGCTWIATGHQKNDNAETVLHRLLRGTGFRGLAGIRPKRRLDGMSFASPLLCVTRGEIVQYLETRGLHWQEDQTNVDTVYTRNYLRHRLLPFLQQEARGCLVEELAGLATAAGRLYRRVEAQAEEAWSRLALLQGDTVIFPTSDLAALPELVAVELIRKALTRLAVGERDLTERHYQRILLLARIPEGGNTVSLPGSALARREAQQIVLRAARPACRVGLAPPDSEEMEIPVPGNTCFRRQEIQATILPRSEVDPEKLRRDKDPFTEYLDFDRVSLPLVVRTRRPGDRFQPLGMGEEKKVGKFLTTVKVPADLRPQILIFADREKIVWVCPVRLSEQVKVTENTQRVIQLIVR